MQNMRTVKQSINVCHPRQDLRDESHLLSLERSNSISRVGSIVNPKYRFFRKIPHICATHSANHFSDDMRAKNTAAQPRSRGDTSSQTGEGETKGGDSVPLFKFS